MSKLPATFFRRILPGVLLCILGIALNLLVSLVRAQTSAGSPFQVPSPISPADQPTTRISLFNGKDLTGWKIYVGTTAPIPATAPASQPAADAPKVWSITEGILKLDTKSAGYVLTEKTFANYHLHVEWRYPKDAAPRSNSGILVHINGTPSIWPSCFECQLQSGNAGQVVGQGLDIPDAPMQNNRKRAARLPTVVEKPLGEWNVYDITAKGDTLDVAINGAPANKVTKLPVQSGAIALQMEGFPIEFQNIWLDPLPESK